MGYLFDTDPVWFAPFAGIPSPLAIDPLVGASPAGPTTVELRYASGATAIGRVSCPGHGVLRLTIGEPDLGLASEELPVELAADGEAVVVSAAVTRSAPFPLSRARAPKCWVQTELVTTVLVTGATDGIGRRVAHQLAAAGARVVVHGRDPGRVAETVAEIGGAASGVVADFTSLAAVRQLADHVADRPLDVLVNNAAVFAERRRTTQDGHELTWQVNHLAGALLAERLLAQLARGLGRIVFVSAAMHSRSSLDLDDPDATRRPYHGQRAYGQSKLAQVMFCTELARRLGTDPPVTVTCVHPGVVRTKLQAAAFGMPQQQTLQQSAEAVTRLALSTEVSGVTGAFFLRDQQVPITGPASDTTASRALYTLTCRAVGVPGLPG